MEDGQLLACWPVVLNKSFEESEIRTLLVQNHKVKVTDSTGQGVIIFPLSSVAFMIVPLAQVFNEIEGRTTLSPDIIQRIERLHQIHRHAYIVVVAAQLESEEVQALTALQNRFLGTKSRFILAQSPKECVDYMMMVAKVTWKPMATVIDEEMKTLRQTAVDANVVLQVLSTIGLNSHECLVLQHGCKTLAAVSQATEDDLLNCSLDQQTARKVKSFFEKDCIQI